VQTRDVLLDTSIPVSCSAVNVAGADTITCTTVPEVTAYGMFFLALVPAANNTGPATLKIGTLSALPVVKANGSALAAADLVSGKACVLWCTGTEFRLII